MHGQIDRQTDRQTDTHAEFTYFAYMWACSDSPNCRCFTFQNLYVNTSFAELIPHVNMHI